MGLRTMYRKDPMSNCNREEAPLADKLKRLKNGNPPGDNPNKQEDKNPHAIKSNPTPDRKWWQFWK